MIINNMEAKIEQNTEPVKMNFSIIDLQVPIEIPIVKETGRKEWVEFGEDNLFTQYLLDIYTERSITHRAITDRKIDMISGNGFEIPASPTPEYIEFLKNKFNDDDLEIVVKKITVDYELTDSFAIGVIWNGDRTKIAQLYHIPIQTIRFDKNFYKSYPKYFWVSDDWNDLRKCPPRKIQCFSKNPDGDKHQIYYHKKYSVGNKWYAVPKYYGSLNWFIAEYEIAAFHKNAIINGFSAGFLLSFNTGVPTPEEMKRAYKEIQDKFTGPNGAGKFILAFSNGQDQKPELTKIDLNDSDKRYTELNDLIRQNIFVAHAVINPMLYGVFVPGQLGGRLELEESLQIFQAVYIDYRQRDIEKCINYLASINGVTEPYILKKYKI